MTLTHVFGVALVIFSGYVLLHLLFTRLVCGQAFVRNGYLFFAVMSALVAFVIVPRGGLFAAVFYLFTVILWNLYLTFFINLTNSVSLRLMVEIDQAPGRALSTRELLALYSDEAAFESRLQAMAASGLIELVQERLVLTRKGRRLAVFLLGIRRIFGIEFFG